MSLISPQDRKIAVKALELLLVTDNTGGFSTSEVQALINWIKLEQSKHNN